MPLEPFLSIGQRSSKKLVVNGWDYNVAFRSMKCIRYACASKNITKCRAKVRINNDKTVEILSEDHNHERSNRQNAFYAYVKDKSYEELM